ncbi:uncharacterized protein LOC129568983 [Sitodiplosis mosellana]|uniref:uncharacterized protein LOC129568983 n=1 Tax=Sitodiplosis mosellana TaxID=263140 RepID=UPI002444E1AC|nr:uncharacterized protein LOC129568983 [Sitodiplosis mosellana]
MVYNMTGQVIVNIIIVAFVILASVANAFAYRLAIDKSDEKPLVSERFSINNGVASTNESVAQREVINHVHHQHQQTIGNVHILTNIDIANLITILNASTPTFTSHSDGQPTDATAVSPITMTTLPGSTIDSTWNPNRDDIASTVDERQQFKRLERNRGIDSKPFKFPTMNDYVRQIRWPTERHSVHAIDSEPAAAVNRDQSIVFFPRSESTMLENTDMKPITVQSNEINDEPLLPNSVNSSVFVVNQTAIDNGLEPFVYVNDDGVFQVKYVPKGENVSQSNDNRQHSNEPSLASINKTEETAIISNDNRQIPRDHRISTEANNERPATTIDPIHDVSPINNTEMIFQWTEAQKDSTEQQKQQQPPATSSPPSSSDEKQPRLFNGHPIFA